MKRNDIMRVSLLMAAVMAIVFGTAYAAGEDTEYGVMQAPSEGCTGCRRFDLCSLDI